MYILHILFTTDSLLVCHTFTGLCVSDLPSHSLPSPECKLHEARSFVYLLLTQHLEYS